MQQKLLHLFISSCQFFKLLEAAGIIYTPAIKNKPTSITTIIFRDAIPVRKTIDMHYQQAIRRSNSCFISFDDAVIYYKRQHLLQFG